MSGTGRTSRACAVPMCAASSPGGPRASSVWDDAARCAALNARAVTRYVPILGWLPRYERRWLPADALAGLSVWALLVPQSLAYATLAGVPVQYGLYTAFAALLMYPIFGTSRQLAEGPSAAVCAVVAATITPLLGTAGGDGSYLEQLWKTIGQIPDADLTTVAVGCGSLAVLLALRRVAPKMPRALIVMALAIGAVDVFSLADHGVTVTGDVPTGLFTVGIPDVPSSDIGKMLLGALAVIFVGYSESLAAARAMATKHGYEIDPNQELIAQGAACGAAGLVGGFAVDGSLSKSSVADAAGQQTQMASLINAVFILLTLLFLASIFENLPSATLGAVVIDALVGLLTLTGLRRYLNTSRSDFVFFAGAMLGILAFGIIAGILIGVALSLLLLIARSSRTSVRPLGREPVSGVFHDLDDQPGLVTDPEVLVLRIDGPLFFADADHFRSRVHELAFRDPPPSGVVVDAESVFLTDTDGADILVQVAGELRARGITLALARVHPACLDLWRRAGVLDALGEHGIHETIEGAVATLTAAPPAAGVT